MFMPCRHNAQYTGTGAWLIKLFLYRILCGLMLGISVCAPGFSGSFLAIVLGVYQDILRIVSNPFRQFKKNIVFIIPIGIGILISAVLFVIAFDYLFKTYEKATYLLFVGLIAGNLPVILSEVKDIGFQKRYLFGVAAAFAVALLLGIFAIGAGQSDAPSGVTSSLPWLALGGFVAGVFVMIPGTSVSMVMLIMGVYSQVLFTAGALLHLDFTGIIPFAVFCATAVAGLVLASRGIKAVFKKFPGFANSLVFGFMSGSLIGLLVESLLMDDSNFNWLLGGVMLAAGLCVSMLFVVMGRAMNRQEELKG